MIRYVALQKLADETFFAKNIECFEQIWSDGSSWMKYTRIPRYSNGLSLVCSPVEVRYVLRDGTKISATQGDLVYIPREYLYAVSFHHGGKGVDLYTINFELADQDGNEVRLSEGFQVYHGAVTQPCLDLAAELFEACLLSGSKLKRQALLLRLFDAFSGFFERHSENFYPIRRGATLLMKEWNKNEKIAKYAAACGISERNFYAYFKKWCGKTPVEYRNEIRLTAAASLLKRSCLTVAEIAFKSGFEDPYYFSRLFKKKHGVSPALFRQAAIRSPETLPDV